MAIELDLTDLETQLLLVTEDLGLKHIELGMATTGKWLKSLEVIMFQAKFGGQILAEDYTEQLADGRPPGNMPPVTEDGLIQWVEIKFGLKGKAAESAAWAVATKIADKGTTWHEQGGSDLISGVLTDERTDDILESVGSSIAFQIGEVLEQGFKNIG